MDDGPGPQIAQPEWMTAPDPGDVARSPGNSGKKLTPFAYAFYSGAGA
jgi:hypothetical protein